MAEPDTINDLVLYDDKNVHMASGKTLTVNGATALSNLSTTGNQTVGGTLTVTGASNLNGGAAVTGNITASLSATIGGNLDHNGTFLGFLGAALVQRQVIGAAATDAVTTQTLANNIRTALINLGLCSAA